MRRILALAALCALAVPAPGRTQELPPAPGPCERPDELIPGAPLHVELVTVSADAFAVTWLTCDGQGRPLPSDTTVAYGAEPNPTTWRMVTPERDVAYHHAEIRGLRPGTTYFYTVSSGGIPGRPDRYHPGVFTTLSPPPGAPLLRFAVVADSHIGEHTSGLATSTPFPFPPGYHEDEYAERMTRAAVDQIDEADVGFTIVTADNSSHGELDQLRDARDILDRLERPYVIVRGSHDRPNQYAGARAQCPSDGDCFRKVFFPNRPAPLEPRHIYYAKFKPRFALIGLDSANLASGMGEISDAQLAWLDEKLTVADEREIPAFVFFHHPVSEWQTTLAVPPLIFGVNQQDAQQFLQVVGEHDSVRAVLTSHTHRNWIGYSPWTGRVPILEMGPAKEYPGGYSIVEVYRKGFVRTFHRLECTFCRRWIATTRWQYLGMYPHYTTGSLRDRNFVHRWDGADLPAGPPSLPFNVWPPGAPMVA